MKTAIKKQSIKKPHWLKNKPGETNPPVIKAIRYIVSEMPDLIVSRDDFFAFKNGVWGYVKKESLLNLVNCSLTYKPDGTHDRAWSDGVLDGLRVFLVAEQKKRPPWPWPANLQKNHVDCRNGVVVLEEKTIKFKSQHAAKTDYCRMQVNAWKKPNASCADWCKFLSRGVRSSLAIKKMQKFFGSCLLPGDAAPSFLWLHGPGPSLVIAGVLFDIIGRENVFAPLFFPEQRETSAKFANPPQVMMCRSLNAAVDILDDPRLPGVRPVVVTKDNLFDQLPYLKYMVGIYVGNDADSSFGYNTLKKERAGIFNWMLAGAAQYLAKKEPAQKKQTGVFMGDKKKQPIKHIFRCKVKGCLSKKNPCRGFCNTHYREYRAGKRYFGSGNNVPIEHQTHALNLANLKAKEYRHRGKKKKDDDKAVYKNFNSSLPREHGGNPRPPDRFFRKNIEPNKDDYLTLKIKFNGHPDIFKRFCERAAEEFRAPAAHALYLIFKDGNQKEK